MACPQPLAGAIHPSAQSQGFPLYGSKTPDIVGWPSGASSLQANARAQGLAGDGMNSSRPVVGVQALNRKP
jgi:hypothetical protein